MKKQSKPRDYWKNFGNLKSELEKIISTLNHFPTQQELAGLGHSSISYAISKYYSGRCTVMETMGYKVTKRQNGYWQNWENIEKELRRIIKQVGYFPNEHELQRLGLSTLALYISRYHGGMRKVRTRLGFEIKKREDWHWKNWENTDAVLKKVIKYFGHFPTLIELRENGYSSVSSAISEHHGGINAVRIRMGYEIDKRENGYWKDLKNIEAELKKVIEKLGHFPSQVELGKLGMSSIASAVDKYGGMNAVKQKLGYRITKRRSGYWRDWENVENQLGEVLEKLGHFPTQRELENIRRADLSSAIGKYHGGFPAVRERMGYGNQASPSLLETYVGEERG